MSASAYVTVILHRHYQCGELELYARPQKQMLLTQVMGYSR